MPYKMISVTEQLKRRRLDQKNAARTKSGKPRAGGGNSARAAARAGGGNSARAAARAGDKTSRMNNIAVYDCETMPADAATNAHPTPFLGVIVSNILPDPIVVWDNDPEQFIERMIQAFDDLPAPHTIYAHNGGKFDWMLLIKKIRGQIMFKGRGVLQARIGKDAQHEIRDSSHIIPVRLSEYRKDEFDYTKNMPDVREQHKEENIRYCTNDCRYTLELVLKFRERYGNSLSIGGASSKLLAKSYTVATLGEVGDRKFRAFFHGGRVECIAAPGTYNGHFKHYDVNSMYPRAMEHYKHPISASYTQYDVRPDIREDTMFIDLTCDNNRAFPMWDEAKQALRFDVPRGRFQITIHEYNVAIELGLISNIKLHQTIDWHITSDFSAYVNPLYEERAVYKARKKADKDDLDARAGDIFTKSMLVNAFGRFAIDPRRFKDNLMTENPCHDAADLRAAGYTIRVETDGYLLWTRPAVRQRFSNVATAASITGAGRAILLRGLANATSPLYCDTDSIVCEELHNHELHPTRLGAWDLEKEYSQFIVYAKKTYGGLALNLTTINTVEFGTGKEEQMTTLVDGRIVDLKDITLKAKGVANLTYDELLYLEKGGSVTKTNPFPTLYPDGTYEYIKRTLGRKPAPKRSK